MSFTTGILTGTYQTWDGTPASGTIEIIPNSPALIDAEGDVILSGRVKVRLGHAAAEGEEGADADGWVNDGAFSVVLPATDDETVEPATGRQYTVVAKLRHQHLKAVNGIELATGETVDMADVTSAAETTASLSLFLTAEEYAAVVARVATLEGAPAVTKASLGLGSVDNTSDAAKPVSTAQATALAAKADATAVNRTPARAVPTQPIKKVIQAFQSGHAWTTTNNVAGTSLNDTVSPGLGTQSVKIVTGTANTSWTLVSPTLTALDLTARDFKLLIKVDGVANLADLRFYAGDSTFANARNINLLANETGGSEFSYLKEGEWTWITVRFADGSSIGTPNQAALTKYQFRIQATSGNSSTLHVGAVAHVPNPAALFPFGAVSFTTDDGRRTGFTVLRNRLDRYGWAASAYPIRDRIASDQLGAYVTLAELQTAYRQSGWEIACHANSGTSHDAGFTTLTTAQVEADLLAERQWIYDNGLGSGEGFAWPRGMSTATHEAAVARVCSYGRGNYTATVYNRETLPPPNPHRVRAFNVGPLTTLATLQGFVDNACVIGRGWLILTFHEVVASPVASTEAAISVCEGIADYIAGLTNQPAVLPMADVMRKLI